MRADIAEEKVGQLEETFDAIKRIADRELKIARETVARLEKERDAARHEMSQCDDIKLDQPLADCISELQRDRERLERQLNGFKAAYEAAEARVGKAVSDLYQFSLESQAQ